jgi:hypothetical protein
MRQLAHSKPAAEPSLPKGSICTLPRPEPMAVQCKPSR